MPYTYESGAYFITRLSRLLGGQNSICFLSDYICCKGTLHPSISLFSIVWILFHKPLPLRWVDPFFSETKKGFTTAHVSNPNVDIGLGV